MGQEGSVQALLPGSAGAPGSVGGLPWQPAQQRALGAMAEQDRARPRITFFPPPQSRQPGGARFADLDLEQDSAWFRSQVSSSSSSHTLLLLQKKAKHFEEAKRKTERFHEQLQQQFVKQQERRLERRRKATQRFEKSLEVLSRRSGQAAAPRAGDGAAPSEHAAPTDGKGTETGVWRAPPAGSGPRPPSTQQRSAAPVGSQSSVLSQQ
ncbi:uncharacterized protein LOC134167434 [Pezoporus occidentalis]|uniref:uncharacterized protein LOC134167434 n=1 Tax=Pezoporus occidentalis TaxID=407982 RepID=UPI002F919476